MTGIRHIDAARQDAASCRAASPGFPGQAEVARRLQERTNGRWLCWFGFRTGRYWAIPTVPRLFRLVEGRTPEDLRTAMAEFDAFHGDRFEAHHAHRPRGQRPAP
ncbi:MAG: hypothetical protein ACRDOO_22170 [Actinomadura sp.]